jgi:hypothetical protein
MRLMRLMRNVGLRHQPLRAYSRRMPRYLTAIILLLGALPQNADAQQILQTVEPGIGYARFKQWAIENKLLFENFTKDSLIVRDADLQHWETIRIQVRFCGGDDYSGRASNIIIQQLFDPTDPKIDVVAVERDYIEFLSGKANPDGKLPGQFSVRRDLKDGSDGLAISQQGEKEIWEVGLFKRDKFRMLQTTRRRDSVCG